MRMWRIHVAAAAWIGGTFAFAHYNELQYGMLLQEDRFVEWLTVGLFASAAVLHIRRALPQRQIFDFLIAAFCLFVAGEEFSWGQRLVGYVPPEVFLEYNKQQEFTLHNFAIFFGKPKGILTAALLGYALLLPLVNVTRRGSELLDRIGATPPPSGLIPWFVAAAVLLVWYPLELTGEWVEMLAGLLFVASAWPSARAFGVATICSIAAAALLSLYSARRVSDPRMSGCAQREVNALIDDVIRGNAATNKLSNPDYSIHKRVYTSYVDGYIDLVELRNYSRIACGKSRQFVLDPWGMPYWIRVSDEDAGVRYVEVYSMGANRRRDSAEGVAGGDDVIGYAKW